MMTLKDRIAERYQQAGIGRLSPAYTEIEAITLDVLQEAIAAAQCPVTPEQLNTLLADNRSLHAKVARLERKLRRIDPSGEGSHLLDGR